jgi:hypothetical protein
VIIVMDTDRVERDLAAGVIACPACATPLRPWAHGRARSVRLLDGTTLWLRPRRGRCPACRRTQVLLPGSVLPRRADATAVIGAALLARAAGHSARRIAADLDRPASTVRRWLHRLDPTHLLWLRRRGVDHAVSLDAQTIIDERYQPTLLAQALSGLVAAVTAWRNRFTGGVEAWTLIGVFTAGRLLTPL